MGSDLFVKYHELVSLADSILGFSVRELCLEDPTKNLHKTQYTQPALFVVNVLSFQDRIGSTRQLPDYVAGHSLGEYAALVAAEVFDFETGLKLVMKRGQLMSRAKGGGMASVI